MVAARWRLVESPEFIAARNKFDPIPHRFDANFKATRLSLEKDPDLYSVPLFDDDPDRRMLATLDFQPGWEVTVVFDVDRSSSTCTLRWVDRIWVGPELGGF